MRDDPAAQLVLQVVVEGVGQHDDADVLLRQPAELCLEAEARAAVVEHAHARRPLVEVEAECVAEPLLGRDGERQPPLLSDQLGRQQRRAVAQLQAEELQRVLDARPEAAGGDHRHRHRQRSAGRRERPPVTDRAVGVGLDRRGVEGRARHPQRRQQLARDPVGEGRAGGVLEDPAGEVDAEVGVLVVVADREAQPGPRDAGAVGVEAAAAEVEVGAVRRLVREPGGVAEQVPQRDQPAGIGVEDAVDGEPRQQVGDRRVEVDEALRDGDHRGGRGHQLGGRLDAEAGRGRDRRAAAADGRAEPARPAGPVGVADADRQPGHVAGGHRRRDLVLQLPDQLLDRR